MPGFNFMNSINISEYINMNDENTKKLLNKLELNTFYNIKKAFIAITISDVIYQYKDYIDNKKSYEAALKEYKPIKELYDKQKDKTPNLISEMNKKTAAINSMKKQMEDSFSLVSKFIQKNGKLDVKKAFDDRRAKNSDEKKYQADEFLKYLALASYDSEKQKELRSLLRFPISFDEELTEEEQKVVDDRAKEISDKIIRVKKNPPDVDVKKIIDTYNKNTSLEDRIMFIVMHQSKVDGRSRVSVEDFDDAGLEAEEYGFNAGNRISDEERELLDREKTELLNSITINGIDDVKAVLKKLAKLETLLKLQIGKEIKNISNALSEKDFSDEKAISVYNQFMDTNFPSKSLFTSFMTLRDDIEEKIRSEMLKTYNITDETSMEDIEYLLYDDVKARYYDYEATNTSESDTLNSIKSHSDITADNLVRRITSNKYDELYNSAMEEASTELSFDDSEILKLGEKAAEKKDNLLLDYNWADNYGEKIANNCQLYVNISIYQNMDELISSGKSFNSLNSKELFDELGKGIPKVEKDNIENEEPTLYGEVPNKEKLRILLFSEKNEEWEEEKKNNPDDKELLSRNIIKEVDDILKDPAPKPENIHIFKLEDLGWTKNLFPSERALIKDKNEVLKPDQLNHVKTNMGIYVADEIKSRASKIAVTLTPSDAQMEAYNSLGLSKVSNSARLAHYYMYLLAKKPEATVENLMEISDSPELKKEYLDFCTNNNFIGNNNYANLFVWADIYNAATNKLLGYKLPEIDYSSCSNLLSNFTALHTLKTITENVNKLADEQFGQSGLQILKSENKSIDDSLGYLEKIEMVTRPFNNAFYKVSNCIKYNEVSDQLVKTAAKRQLSGLRMNSLGGKTLDIIAHSVPTMNELLLNNFSDENYVEEYAYKVFYDKDTPKYLANNLTPNLKKKMEDAAYNLEEEKANAFSNKLNHNMGLFRRQLKTGTNFRVKIENDLLEKDSAEHMISLLEREYEYSYKQPLSDYINGVFDKLFTNDVNKVFSKNKVNPIDTILIDGNTPTQLWSAKYANVKDASKKDILFKLEIIKAFFKNDKKIELINFKIDKDLKLSEDGKLTLNINKADAEKLIKGCAASKKFCKDTANKLESFMTQLINALPPGEGNDKARVLNEGTDLYKTMAKSLWIAIELLKDPLSKPADIRRALSDLQKASNKYYEKRKGVIFGPREGKGTGRLNASDEIRSALGNIILEYDNILRSLDIAYSFGTTRGTSTDASIEDLEYEIGHIDSLFKDVQTISQDDIKKLESSGKLSQSIINEKSKAQREIISLLSELNPNIKYDSFIKNPTDMVNDKEKMTIRDRALNFVCRKIIEEAFNEQNNIDDMNYILYEIKSGRVNEEINAISKNINSIDNPNFRVNVIEEIHNNHDVSVVQKQLVDIEKQNNRKMFDQRKQYLEKYDNTKGSLNSYYTNDYFDEDAFKNLTDEIRNGSGYTAGRSAIISLMIYALACETDNVGKPKYSLEQLMDKNQLFDIKSAKYREILDLLIKVSDHAFNKEEADKANKQIAEIIYKGHKVMAKLCDEVAEKINFNDDYFDCSKEYSLLVCAGATQYDAWQEIGHCEKEIVALAQAENPEIKNYDDFKAYSYELINPACSSLSGYENIYKFVDENPLNPTDRVNVVSLVQSQMTANYTKKVIKEWGDSNKEKPMPLSEWSKQTDAIVRTINVKKASVGVSASDYSDLSINEFKSLKDKFIDGTLFSDVMFDNNRVEYFNSGISGMYDLSEFNAEKNYKLRGKDFDLDLNSRLNQYDEERKDASPERINYISSAKAAMKKLGEFLKYDMPIKDSRREVVNKCVRAILSEKWCKIFEKKGYKGDDLKYAIKNATEYMMVHDHNVSLLSSKAFIDDIIFTNSADIYVESSVNGLFMGEAGVAMKRLMNPSAQYTEKQLISDAAYAYTAQILRLNGRIPNDADTDTEITCNQYYNTLKNSANFKNVLKNPENPSQFRKPVSILRDTLNDKAFIKDIVLQEKAVIAARNERSDRLYQAQREEIDRQIMQERAKKPNLGPK